MPFNAPLAEQLSDLFEPDIIKQGEQHFNNQAVSALQTQNPVSACVDDPQYGRCKTFIQMDNRQGVLSVDGECSCDREINCDHVVATLLAYLDTETTTQAQVQAQTTRSQLQPQTTQESSFSDDRQIHFLLSLQASHIQLKMVVVSSGQITDFIMPHSLAHPARFIKPADLLLLEQIQQQTRLGNGGAFALSVNTGLLLRDLVTSGLCHWQSFSQPALQWGETVKGRWLWQQQIDGSQQLSISLKDENLEVLPLLPLIFRNKKTQQLGLIDSGLTTQEDQQLYHLPAFQPQEVDALLAQTELKPLLQKLPQPQQVQQFVSAKATPEIEVTLIHQSRHKSNASIKAPATTLSANIHFKYPGGSIQRHNPARHVGEFKDQQFIQWKRDDAAEQALVQNWKDCGWQVFDTAAEQQEEWHLKPDPSGYNAAHFIAFKLPELIDKGWLIQCDKPLPRVYSTDDFFLEAQVTQAANQYQFRLKILLTAVPDKATDTVPESINLLQSILISLHSGWLSPEHNDGEQHALLSTPEQQLLIINYQDLRPVNDCLIELNSKHTIDKEGYLVLSRARLQAVETLVTSLPSIKAKALDLTDITATTSPANDPPKVSTEEESQGINAELRPYQQQGVEWLHQLHQHGLGGLLADDMGLGKTLQVLTFLWQCKCRGLLLKPVMILAPTSLLGNWQTEAKRFTPGLSTLVLHGSSRARYFKKLNDYDLVISSYPLLLRDAPTLLQTDWQILILDEAQAIKNADSQSARTVREFNARMNICLSGTPIENHLGELWALYDFLLPGLLGSKQQFKRWFQDPIQIHKDFARQQLLLERITPVLLRRSKSKVLPQLPPKITQMETIELTEEQQTIYQDIEQQMRQSLRDTIQQRGVEGSRLHILNALTRLRQVCCDPRLLADRPNTSLAQSAKLQRLIEMLEEMIEQGRRILIFSQFTSLLSLLEMELKKRSMDYALLTGQTRQREQQVERFQQGKAALFLISLKAGGSGLNLTRADTVIHYDPWWNPAVENQATDRAHRIGQHQSVMVYKLIAANTIEQKIIEMQQDKQLIADNLLEDGSLQSPGDNDLDLVKLLNLIGV